MKSKFISLLVISLVVACSREDRKINHTFADDNDNTYIIQSESSETSKEYSSNISSSSSEESILLPINDVENTLDEIHSPDQLIECIDNLEKKIDNLSNTLNTISDSQEKIEIETRLNELSRKYEQQFNKYSLPANGILQKMQLLKSRITNCKSEEEFNGILDVYNGYYKKLLNIYKIVQEPNRRNEVREKSQELFDLFNLKAQEYGIALNH